MRLQAWIGYIGKIDSWMHTIAYLTNLNLLEEFSVFLAFYVYFKSFSVRLFAESILMSALAVWKWKHGINNSVSFFFTKIRKVNCILCTILISRRRGKIVIHAQDLRILKSLGFEDPDILRIIFSSNQRILRSLGLFWVVRKCVDYLDNM